MQKSNSTKPKASATAEVGQTIKVHGRLCEIIKVYPFGTVDVISPDGQKAFRVTGLPFL